MIVVVLCDDSELRVLDFKLATSLADSFSMGLYLPRSEEPSDHQISKKIKLLKNDHLLWTSH